MSWPMVKLGEVLTFIRGITFKPEEKIEASDPDAVVCMRTKNIQEELDESDLIAVPKALVKREELFLRHGDILISSANSWNLVGKVVQVP
ncbi:restriction endonuclease subunit S, partial [Enterobacter cloacae complex sp. P3B]|nr:restriction endonuclease subunit S [Enterobacter cloacae complex sp. P3B]